MADSAVTITQGAGTNIDTRTEASNGQHRQVIVIGDPSVNANVGAVATQDIAPSDQTTPAVVVRSAGSLAINLVNASGTLGVHIGSTGGTIGVFFPDTGHELGSIKGINSSVSVHVLSTGGTIGVFLPDTGHEIGSIKGINSSIQVHLLSTGGTLNIKLDPSYATIQDSGTLMIQQTLSGSTSAVSTSGTTIKSPISSRNIKVYAIALTTTAQVGIVAKVTDGSGASPVEKWRYALQAPAQGIAGANISVTPPGYLFSMGSNTTLSLVLDSASLVHYSFGYFLESA